MPHTLGKKYEAAYIKGIFTMADPTYGVKVFSTSTSTASEAKFHHTFDQCNGTFNTMAVACTKRAWSAIVWDTGKRAKVNFQQCCAVVLDIDLGLPVLDAEQWARQTGYAFFIALSKSHQKEKQSGPHLLPPCDRYRVVFDAEPISDLHQYEFNMRHWLTRRPEADGSCVDGGRFFYPSPILFASGLGPRYQWKNFAPEIEFEKRRILEVRQKCRAKFEAGGALSPWLRAQILEGAPIGHRHKKCYALGARMAELGISFEDTMRLICAGPLAEIGITEVEIAVNNARKKVLRG